MVGGEGPVVDNGGIRWCIGANVVAMDGTVFVVVIADIVPGKLECG